MAKIMNVFYGTDALPYKDQERQVHYPIASGNTFNGSSLVDTIHFYVSEIGGTQDIEWVANVKRADGKIGYKKLSPTWDNDIQEYYVSLSLSQWFTAKNGDIFISLNGYQGGLTLEYDSTSQVYTSVSGTPIVQATGCIKLNISYAVQMNNDYGELPSISVQEALGLSASKLDKNSGKYLKVIDNIANINNGSYTPFLSNGDIIYCKTNKAYYSLSFSDNLYTATLLDLTLFNNIKILGKILTSQNDTYGFKFENTSLFTSDKTLATKEDIFEGSFPKVDYNGNMTIEELMAFGICGYINEYGIYQITLGSGNNVDLKVSNSVGYHFLSGDIKSKKLSEFYNDSSFTEYQDLDNLTTTLNGSSSDSQYPSAKVVYDNLLLKENVSNKSDSIVNNATKYPSTKAVYDSNVVLQQNIDSSGHSLNASINTTTYVMTIYLKDSNNNTISSTSVDLPLESIVSSAQYYDTYTYDGTTYQKVIVITLSTTSVPTIVPVGDLISGLVSETQLQTTLSNYYTSSQVDTLIENVKSNQYQTVDTTTYPTLQDFLEDFTDQEDGVVYLYPIDTSDPDAGYYQYVWNSNAGEWIYLGATQVDLTNYYTKSQTYSKSEVDTLLSAKQDTMTALTSSEWDTMIGD